MFNIKYLYEEKINFVEYNYLPMYVLFYNKEIVKWRYFSSYSVDCFNSENIAHSNSISKQEFQALQSHILWPDLLFGISESEENEMIMCQQIKVNDIIIMDMTGEKSAPHLTVSSGGSILLFPWSPLHNLYEFLSSFMFQTSAACGRDSHLETGALSAFINVCLFVIIYKIFETISSSLICQAI